MPKTKISEFSATPGNNTDIDGINLAEGCAPSGINDAIRELMSQLKDFQAGTAGDSFNGPVGTTTAAAGAFTNLSASGTFALTGDQVQISEGGTGQTTANAAFNALAPSQSTHAGKYLKTDGTNTSWDALDISTADITGTLPVANGGTGVTSSTGTGSVVLSASPTFTGTVNGASLTLSSNFTLSGGTANGVAYLNGSKVLTTGSALTYSGGTFANDGAADGTNAITATGNTVGGFIALRPDGTNGQAIRIGGSGAGSNILRFLGSADAEYMRLTSTSLYTASGINVGIGTSSPGARLHSVIADGSYPLAVSGTTKGVRFETNSTETRIVGVDNTLTSSFQPLSLGGSQVIVRTNGSTQAAVFDASGNLGLGVTPSASWSGQSAFQVNTRSAFAGSSNFTAVATNAIATSNGWAANYLATGTAALYTQSVSTGAHAWYTAASGTAGSPISFTQAMTLSASGGLSVGPTSDAGTGNILLNANGKLCGNAPSGGTSSTIELYNSSTGNMSLTAAFSGAAITFATGGTTERARISSDGTFRVKGAGTAGSTDAVQFAGSAPASAMTLTSGGDLLVGTTNANLQAGGVRLKNGGGNLGEIALANNSGSADYVARFLWGSSPTLVGNITVSSTATAYNTSSDRRLKENIAPADDASAIVDAIQVVKHDWKTGGHTRFGVVAQDLHAVAPEAVSAGDNGEEIERTWSVDYSKLVPMLIKEIQSLRARVAALETK